MRKDRFENRALLIYYETEMCSSTKTKILCLDHWDKFRNRHSSARGNGEFFPKDRCDLCPKMQAFYAEPARV